MGYMLWAVISTCAVQALTVDPPPPPNPDQPVDYVAWIDAQFGRIGNGNAAGLYRKAFDLLVGDSKALEIATQAAKVPWTPEQRATLQGWVTRNRQSLSAFVAASRMSDCYFGGSSDSGSLLDKTLPHVDQMKTVCRLVITRARLRLMGGNVKSALNDICALLRAAQHMRSQPHWVEYFVGENMGIVAYEMLLDLPAVCNDGADYQAILKLLHEADLGLQPPSKPFETGRLVFLDALQRYCEDQDGDGRLDHTNAKLANIEFETPLTIQAMIEQYDGLYEPWRNAMSMDYTSGQRLATELRKQRRAAGVGLVSFLMADCWQMSKMLRRTQATRNAARIVLCMHAFRAKNGRWPESLEEATGGESPTIRKDPFALGNLSHRFEDGAPLLYSVGLNGKDDGGKPCSDGKAWGRTGDRVFWPAPGK